MKMRNRPWSHWTNFGKYLATEKLILTLST